MAEAQADEGVALGAFGLALELHVGLVWGAAAFSGVALDAGADEVFPGVHAALRAGHDVVDGELGGWEDAATVLAAVAIAREEVAAVELHRLVGEAVVAEKADDAGDCDLKADGADPVVLFGLELVLQGADLDPGVEVVVDVAAAAGAVGLDMDDLGDGAAQEAEGSLGRDDAHRGVGAIEHEHL